jgi:hypothetical protein
MAEPAAGRPADLERVRQGEQLGGGGVEDAEAPGTVDRQGRIGEGVDERGQLGAGRLDGGGRPGRPQPGGHLSLQPAQGPAPGGVRGFGHQQHEGARLAGGDRQADGELCPGGELGDDGVGGSHHRHVGSRDQPGEAGVAAGGPEPVAVDPPPAHDLDPARSRREADEPGPGPEPGGGHVESGSHHLVGRRGGGDGGQGLGQGQAVIVAAARQDAGDGPGGQGEGGAVGQGRERLGLQRPGAVRRTGHHQGGHDDPPVPDGDGQGGETGVRIRPAGRLPRPVRRLGGLEQHGVRRSNCHNRDQSPL